MKSVMMTYPAFQDLPKGVKRMLLASESFFFGEARMPTVRPARRALTVPSDLKQTDNFTPHSSSALPGAWTHLLLAGKATDVSSVYRSP
jgi:hypothetical protein